jgi:hypothetical protein
MLMQVLLEQILQNLWMKMRFTVQILKKMLQLKLPISLAMMVFVRELDK